MTAHRRLALFAAWILSLAIAGVWGTAYGQHSKDTENLLSGSDIGFRIEGKTGRTIVGDLLVRVDGEWKEVSFSPKVMRVR
jgi:hypothetical protein